MTDNGDQVLRSVHLIEFSGHDFGCVLDDRNKIKRELKSSYSTNDSSTQLQEFCLIGNEHAVLLYG